MIVLTCANGDKTLAQDPCPIGQAVQYTEAVLLTQSEYEAYQAMSGPVDVVLATKIFFFFFTSSIGLWIFGKVIGSVVKFMRDA